MKVLTYMAKRYLAGVIRLRILRWGEYPGLFRWTQYNHKGPYKGGKEAGGSEKES